MQSGKSLEKFEPSKYYNVYYDTTIKDSNGKSPVVMQPNQNARELISQYYAKKYGANIYFPIDTIGKHDSIMGPYLALVEFPKNIKKYLAMIKQTYGNENCRIAFSLGAKSKHDTPIIYIKENNEEGILFADSLGINKNKNTINMIAKETEIDVYVIKDPRQRDMYSCYIDALLFGRDATAKNPGTNDYYIPNLLTFLKSNAKKEELESYYTTKLPDELLKTSQLSEFTKYHHGQEQTGKVIHKNETLEQFVGRYTQKNVTINLRTGVNIPSYLRDKSVKLADKIEIQFYINKMKQILGDSFTDQLWLDFESKAEKILQEQGPVIPSKKDFDSDFPSQTRKGLHEFAMKFFDEIDIQNNNSFKSNVKQSDELIVATNNQQANTSLLFQPKLDLGTLDNNNGNNIDAKVSDEVLILAVQNNDEIVNVLLKNGANVNAKGGENVTALMLAALNGNINLVNVLLKYGAKPDVTDNYGYTALMCAALQGHDEIVEILSGALIKADARKRVNDVIHDLTDIPTHYNQYPQHYCNQYSENYPTHYNQYPQYYYNQYSENYPTHYNQYPQHYYNQYSENYSTHYNQYPQHYYNQYSENYSTHYNQYSQNLEYHQTSFDQNSQNSDQNFTYYQNPNQQLLMFKSASVPTDFADRRLTADTQRLSSGSTNENTNEGNTNEQSQKKS